MLSQWFVSHHLVLFFLEDDCLFSRHGQHWQQCTRDDREWQFTDHRSTHPRKPPHGPGSNSGSSHKSSSHKSSDSSSSGFKGAVKIRPRFEIQKGELIVQDQWITTLIIILWYKLKKQWKPTLNKCIFKRFAKVSLLKWEDPELTAKHSNS